MRTVVAGKRVKGEEEMVEEEKEEEKKKVEEGYSAGRGTSE